MPSRKLPPTTIGSTDPDRSRSMPFGSTIAHGLFTLGLGPAFSYEIYELTVFGFRRNYGYNRVRFAAPLRADSRSECALC
jgi:acyl dehydratase